jgi:hypothetical protein
MKVAQLKALCKEQGLKVSGKKAELQDRLREHFRKAASPDSQPEQDDEIESMSKEDLKHALLPRGLSVTGTKKELQERLRQDIQFTKEMEAAMQPEGRDGYVALSAVLEEATKNEGSVLNEYLKEQRDKLNEVPKFIDVTVTSLGLEPEKHTTGGAPSVTADVIRKLAGDPFADPPKYGSVSR